MRHEFEARLLTIYVGQDDKYQGALLYPAIVARLAGHGIAGVTVLQGIEGIGASHKLHTTRLEALFSSLPVVIEAVDEPAKIDAALSDLDEMMTDGLVTVQEVRAVRYIQSADATDSSRS